MGSSAARHLAAGMGSDLSYTIDAEPYVVARRIEVIALKSHGYKTDSGTVCYGKDYTHCCPLVEAGCRNHKSQRVMEVLAVKTGRMGYSCCRG